MLAFWPPTGVSNAVEAQSSRPLKQVMVLIAEFCFGIASNNEIYLTVLRVLTQKAGLIMMERIKVWSTEQSRSPLILTKAKV